MPRHRKIQTFLFNLNQNFLYPILPLYLPIIKKIFMYFLRFIGDSYQDIVLYWMFHVLIFINRAHLPLIDYIQAKTYPILTLFKFIGDSYQDIMQCWILPGKYFHLTKLGKCLSLLTMLHDQDKFLSRFFKFFKILGDSFKHIILLWRSDFLVLINHIPVHVLISWLLLDYEAL